MSAVGLPQVASARSTASRGSLGSASSSASDRSSRSDRNQRSHAVIASRASATFGASDAANDDDGSDDDDDDEKSECDDDDEGYDDEYDSGHGHGHGGPNAHVYASEEPQEVSGGLWDEVESFLNRPSPSLSALAKPEKKAASGNLLPTLKPGQQQQQRTHRGSEPESHGTATRAANRPARSLYQPSSSKAAAPKAIDPKLLQEAFAYAQKVALMDFDDEQQEQTDVINDRHHPLARSGSRTLSSSSATSLGGKDGPRAPPSHGALRKQNSSGGTSTAKGDEMMMKKKSTSSKSSVYGAGAGAKPVKRKSERRIKEAMQWDPSNAASASDTAGADACGSGASRKHMDPQVMQSLVSNFQNGTTLDELRKELAASQQSMALSRQVLHDAAKSFFQPSR